MDHIEDNSDEDKLYESIEEEIVISQHESPIIHKTKAKGLGMPPRIPRQQ